MEDMLASLGPRYQRARGLRETPDAPPSEQEIQALWFESLFRHPLVTDDGRELTIIQPGLWNHSAGPDFLQAALRDSAGKIHCGPVEIHLNAADWEHHGHHMDAAYDDCILHVVWNSPRREYFPATRNFRRVPQVILSDQLAGPFSQIRPVLRNVTAGILPDSRPGRCQRLLSGTKPEQIVDLLRAAGIARLQLKAERWRWRVKAVGLPQTLWEALAEGLGYRHNKVSFRLLAQRLPVASLVSLPEPERMARLFGLAGFLPDRDLSVFPVTTRREIKPSWDRWWKIRSSLDYAILPRSQWKLAGLRPLNRPERRLAALALLAPRIPRLLKLLDRADAKGFEKLLGGLTHLFWDRHTTWRAPALKAPARLLGDERINDLLINAFLPLLSLEDPSAAWDLARSAHSAPNQSTRIARQRVLGMTSIGTALSESLVRQGLHQIYQDFCQVDASDCAQCSFPEIASSWVTPSV